MSESDRGRPGEHGSELDRQDSTGVDVPAGKSAGAVEPEQLRPARALGREDEEREARPEGSEGRVVATVHADASPAREERGVKPIGNTDVPVNARDPDAP